MPPRRRSPLPTLCHHGAVADGGPRSPDEDDRRWDHVRLALPPGGPAAALARAATVTLGRQAGFGRTVIGALTLAVDEALVLVLPVTDSGVDLDVNVGAGALRLTVTPRHPHTPPDPVALARFDDVVADLVGSATIDPTSGAVRLEVGERPGEGESPDAVESPEPGASTDPSTDPATGGAVP